MEFLNKMNVGEKALNQTAVWAKQEDIQGEWEKAAIYFLRTYEDRWTTWMPADKVQKVKEALEKAGA